MCLKSEQEIKHLISILKVSQCYFCHHIQNNQKKRKNKVKQNIRCILSHFKEPCRQEVQRMIQHNSKSLAGKYFLTSSFHIYQPIEPHPLEQIKQFIDHIIRQYPELQLILKFPEQIFDSCPSMLLIPDTFDSNIEKRKDVEIMLIQKWDGFASVWF